MIQTGRNLEMHSDFILKLRAGEKLWLAAHEDGSKNRIDENVVFEAGTYSTSLGILAALLMGIRKKFRTRGKTKEDFAAEKEAAGINRTCVALEELLLEYTEGAQNGQIDEETLMELIDALREMEGYEHAGKLSIPGRQELEEIRQSIENYTSALAERYGAGPLPETGETADGVFGRIREQLERQRDLLGSR